MWDSLHFILLVMLSSGSTKISIFTLTYTKLCERTMSIAVHPALGLHGKALEAEGPQGWTLSRAQELPRVRSEPDRANSASNTGQASGRADVRKGKTAGQQQTGERGETREMQPCNPREAHRGAGCPFAAHRHCAEHISAHGEPLQEQPQAGAQNLGHLEKLPPTDRTLTHNDKKTHPCFLRQLLPHTSTAPCTPHSPAPLSNCSRQPRLQTKLRISATGTLWESRKTGEEIISISLTRDEDCVLHTAIYTYTRSGQQLNPHFKYFLGDLEESILPYRHFSTLGGITATTIFFNAIISELF